MTYTERLTEIAEKMATVLFEIYNKDKDPKPDYDEVRISEPEEFEEYMQGITPLAEICLSELVKEAKQFYRNGYQDCGNNMPPDSKPYLDNSGLIP